MASAIFVATPNAAFGELIRQSLEEHAGCRVEVTTDLMGLAERCEALRPAIAILDSDLDGRSLPEIARHLRQVAPELRLVVIPPDGDDAPAFLAGLDADALLSKPFYLPDLFALVDGLLSPDGAPREAHPLEMDPPYAPTPDRLTPEEPPAAPAARPLAELAWLADAASAEARLEAALRRLPAQSGLIVRAGELWACAGRLPRPAGEELAGLVMRYWDAAAQSDLARYVRLSGRAAELMLYATPLSPEAILALAFEVTIPLNRIRAQVRRAARRLISVEELAAEADAEPGEPAAARALSWNGYEIEAWNGEDEDAEGEEPGGIDEEQATAEFLAMLASFPPPDPEFQPVPSDSTHPAAQDWFNEQSGEPMEATELPAERAAAEVGLPGLDDDFLKLLEGAEAHKAAGAASELQWPDEGAAVGDEVDEPTPVTIPIPSPTPAPAPVEEPPIDPLADTSPVQIVAELHPEPSFPGMADVTYTGVLIPRFPRHHLTGKLGSSLSHWLPELCLSYGWRLEGMVIRPDYIHWIVRVVPAVSPSGMLRVFRRQTSQWIFREFPDFKQENLSDDFWAPGYLILSGSQYPPANLLREYRQQTRLRQGVR